MREAHPKERQMGIEWYVSATPGTGGRLRANIADFHVREREGFTVDIQPVTADSGSYPHLVFRATLHGWDTNDFASALANALGISRERVSWAGTKDKRGITTQLFSVRLTEEINYLPEISDTSIEVLGRAGRPVLFGDLVGNEFAITISDPDHGENATQIATDLREFGTGLDSPASTDPIGVPNYFGHQRFGSMRPITHRVGLDIVRKEWESAAVRYITESSEDEPVETRRARETLAETREWEKADDLFPHGLRYERAIAGRLAESDSTADDYRAALEVLPTNLQQLLVNAAQSYIFNRIVSERLDRNLPFRHPILGDVVCFPDDDGVPDPSRTQTVESENLDIIRRHCDNKRAFVTAPLVGANTTIEDHEPGEIVHSILGELDITPEQFDLPGAFGSTGTRRAILVTTQLSLAFDPLTMSFSLPKGCYATVVAREFLKVHPSLLG